MRAANITRVKRRLVREAVAENLDVIRGMPPRSIRPLNRFFRLWTRRALFVAVPLTLVGSTYVISQTTPPPAVAPAKVIVSSGAAGFSPPKVETGELKPAAPQTERVTSAAFPLAVRRVVIDAGHGGTDPGATTAQIQEKEITLDIGRRLRMLLEREGFEVVVTRESDHTIALKDRARLANESKSDIFLSIHVNALIKHTESRGIETYYLGATSDPSLTALAAAENRVSGYSMADMRKLLDGIYADARRDESQELARSVQKKLFTSLHQSDPGLENWGVKRAPFIVLVATDMPAILAEVGCISNEREAAMLRNAEYRQKIADALFEGIRAYSGANDGQQQKKGSEQNG